VSRTEFLTVPEVMAYLRLGRTTVYSQARLYLATGGAEGIPCRRFGRSLRFPADELARFADTIDSGVPAAAAVPTSVRATPVHRSPRRVERSRSSSRSRSQQSTRTASATADDTVVQAALPFAD
jgi:hypothetical protein